MESACAVVAIDVVTNERARREARQERISFTWLGPRERILRTQKKTPPAGKGAGGARFEPWKGRFSANPIRDPTARNCRDSTSVLHYIRPFDCGSQLTGDKK